MQAVDIYKDASILNLNSTFKTLCQSWGAVSICTPNYFVIAKERSVSVLKKISLSTLACYFFLSSGGTIQIVHLGFLSSWHLRIRSAFQFTKLPPKTLRESLYLSHVTQVPLPKPTSPTIAKAVSGENHWANLIQTVFC